MMEKLKLGILYKDKKIMMDKLNIPIHNRAAFIKWANKWGRFNIHNDWKWYKHTPIEWNESETKPMGRMWIEYVNKYSNLNTMDLYNKYIELTDKDLCRKKINIPISINEINYDCFPHMSWEKIIKAELVVLLNGNNYNIKVIKNRWG